MFYYIYLIFVTDNKKIMLTQDYSYIS